MPPFSSAFDKDVYEYQTSRPLTSTASEVHKKEDLIKQNLDNMATSFQTNTQIFVHNFSNTVAWKVREINKYISPEDEKKMFPILPYQVIPTKQPPPEVPDFNPYPFKLMKVPMSSQKSTRK